RTLTRMPLQSAPGGDRGNVSLSLIGWYLVGLGVVGAAVLPISGNWTLVAVGVVVLRAARQARTPEDDVEHRARDRAPPHPRRGRPPRSAREWDKLGRWPRARRGAGGGGARGWGEGGGGGGRAGVGPGGGPTS